MSTEKWQEILDKAHQGRKNSALKPELSKATKGNQEHHGYISTYHNTWIYIKDRKCRNT